MDGIIGVLSVSACMLLLEYYQCRHGYYWSIISVGMDAITDWSIISVDMDGITDWSIISVDMDGITDWSIISVDMDGVHASFFTVTQEV